MERAKAIVRTSFVGIGINLVLVLIKIVMGLLTHSIAVILDGVNNASDALSSVITILGTKLAARRPDKKHPYGYGRVEYLTSIIIAVLVLLAGATSLRESIAKIITPDETNYTVASLILLAFAVIAKIFCGTYFKKRGNALRSDALIASGTDALFDAILSTATLAGAAAAIIWGLKLEGILGTVISLFIIKAGLEMLFATLNTIIGKRVDRELSLKLKKKVTSFEGVLGAYDLSLHNYGPTQIIGSIHIEVSDAMTARDLHFLSRKIAEEVFTEYGVILTVGIYAASDSSEELTEIKNTLIGIVAEKPEILQMHGFYGDVKQKTCTFDLIVDFKADAKAVMKEVRDALQESYPSYRFDILLDSDVSD